MSMFSIMFVAFAGLVAIFSAHAAWQMRRDTANWAIDLADGGVRFRNWPGFVLAVLSCSMGCGIIAFAL